jgi:hypothetical protein
MFGLAHFDSTPLIYGVVMFIGIWSMWAKFIGGRWLGLIIEISIFVLVFKLHGGSMAGGFAAMVAAMIAGFVLPRTLK